MDKNASKIISIFNKISKYCNGNQNAIIWANRVFNYGKLDHSSSVCSDKIEGFKCNGFGYKPLIDESLWFASCNWKIKTKLKLD